MSKLDLQTDDFVRIDWPNGSTLAGQVHVGQNGTLLMRFGPEGDRERWILLGNVVELHPFVQAGSLQVIRQGVLF